MLWAWIRAELKHIICKCLWRKASSFMKVYISGICLDQVLPLSDSLWLYWSGNLSNFVLGGLLWKLWTYQSILMNSSRPCYQRRWISRGILPVRGLKGWSAHFAWIYTMSTLLLFLNSRRLSAIRACAWKRGLLLTTIIKGSWCSYSAPIWRHSSWVTTLTRGHS